MKSPIKWAGSKRKLLPHLREYAEMWKSHNNATGQEGVYYEPFAGGASLFFDLQPAVAELSDVNPDLIAFYRWLRDDVQGLEESVFQLHSLSYARIKSDFNEYARQAEDTADYAIQQSARFLALLHLGFNGLWRVNKSGEMNTPEGKDSKGVRKSLGTLNWGHLAECGKLLDNAALLLGDFRSPLIFGRAEGGPGPGDFVYFDPPFLKTFSGYAKDGFNRKDHEDLAAMCLHLANNGAFVVLSGSCNEASLEVYGEPTKVIETKYSIAAKSSDRVLAKECLWVWGMPT